MSDPCLRGETEGRMCLCVYGCGDVMWGVLCFALLLAAVVLFTLLLIRDGMDRDGWGCGVVREELYRVRCLVLAVCVCLWNNTAAYEEGSVGKEKHRHRSPYCGVCHISRMSW